MSLYYLVVNLDREEYLDPRHFGSGIKLFEFAGGLVTEGLSILLAQGYGASPYGDWANQRILLASDEADDEFLTPSQQDRWRQAVLTSSQFESNREAILRRGPNVYGFAYCCCRNISEEVILGLDRDEEHREAIDDLLENRWSYVPADVIERIRARVAEQRQPFMEKRPRPSGPRPAGGGFMAGDHVVVVQGQFQGTKGIILGVAANCTVVQVELDIFGKPIPFEMPASDLDLLP